ncbi:MAG: hypothetical protein ABSH20_10410 [Tepidisphaeraceae bacterium]|jgi:septation ring formation regulator EzrA
MKLARQGAASTAIIGGIVLVVVIGLVAYFASDVFRTKVDSNVNQMTKWTPENIAKDPVNYLNFCEKKINEAVDQLRADRISVAQNKAKLTDMKDTAAAKVRTGEKVLPELKGIYEQAEKDNAWPVTYNDEKRDKDWMRTYILKINKETETQRIIFSKVDGGLKKLDTQVAKIEKAQADAQTQLADISANRELLKVQKLTDDLKDRLVTMNGAVQGVIDVAGDKGSMPSLADLTAGSTPAADTAEFDKVMGKIK